MTPAQRIQAAIDKLERLKANAVWARWLADHDRKVKTEALKWAQEALSADGWFCPAIDDAVAALTEGEGER